MPDFDVVSPVGIKADRLPWQPAARVPDLNGKTVGLLWDYIYRGEVIFDVVQKELRARFPNVTVHGYDNFGNIHGPGEKKVIAELPGLLKKFKCDVSIAGIGS